MNNQQKGMYKITLRDTSFLIKEDAAFLSFIEKVSEDKSLSDFIKKIKEIDNETIIDYAFSTGEAIEVIREQHKLLKKLNYDLDNHFFDISYVELLYEESNLK